MILADMIRKAESGKYGYNALNRGTVHSATTEDFSQYTIRELMARQALPIGDPGRFFAVGGYQIVPKTMIGAVEDLKPPLDTPVTPELQDFLFAWHLLRRKRPAIQRYIEGISKDRKAAQVAMALEWASLAHPDTGKSAYDGVAGNSASVSASQVGEALDEARARFAAATASGTPYEQAWELAVFNDVKREPWNAPTEPVGGDPVYISPSPAPILPPPAYVAPVPQPGDSILQDPDFRAWKAEREKARTAEAYRQANAKPLASSLVTKFVVGGIASWLAVRYGIDIPPEWQGIAEDAIVGLMGAGAIYGRQRATTFISGIFTKQQGG